MEWVNGCVATSDFSYEISAVREVIPFFCNFILSILHHNQWVFVPYGSEILFISLLFKWIDSIGRFTPSFPKPAIIVCRFISFVIPLWALSRWIFELVLRNISKNKIWMLNYEHTKSSVERLWCNFHVVYRTKERRQWKKRSNPQF